MGGFYPWLAKLIECPPPHFERTTFQLDGGGVAVWSRLLYGRLSAYRPSFRGGMHHTFGTSVYGDRGLIVPS